ncbi:unnamed protein product [Brassica oleracea]|uniref:(rape) hypothetical protein n=1 Tax=Brassica napus TaxID=3708 RepID=A0A816KDK4_BRANA|nr:unnamed protein product [Brassica napus]
MNEDVGDGGDDGDRDDDGVYDGVDDKDFEDNNGYVNHISLEAHLFCKFQARREKDPLLQA